MLPNKLIRPCLRWSLAIFILFFILPAFAQVSSAPVTAPNAQSMLQNIATQVPYLMRMVTAIAYVLGFFLVIGGLQKLKHMGEMRTMMSQEHSPKGPLLMIMVGSMLIYLPSTVQMGMTTFWANPNPFGYQVGNDQWSQFFNTVVIIMQLIGVIAFIRGMLIMSHLGQGGGQQGGFAKGLTHIIAGILLINLYGFVQVLMATLGISFS